MQQACQLSGTVARCAASPFLVKGSSKAAEMALRGERVGSVGNSYNAGFSEEQNTSQAGYPCLRLPRRGQEDDADIHDICLRQSGSQQVGSVLEEVIGVVPGEEVGWIESPLRGPGERAGIS